MAQLKLARWQQQVQSKEQAKANGKAKEEIEMKGGRYTRIFVDDIAQDGIALDRFVLPGQQKGDLEHARMEIWFGILRSVTFL